MTHEITSLIIVGGLTKCVLCSSGKTVIVPRVKSASSVPSVSSPRGIAHEVLSRWTEWVSAMSPFAQGLPQFESESLHAWELSADQHEGALQSGVHPHSASVALS